jgi:hypothetical protein
MKASNLRREHFFLRLLFYPIAILQFFLVNLGWRSLLPFVEEKFQLSINEKTWFLFGTFFALLFLVYPFYLKLTDVSHNRVYRTHRKLNGFVNNQDGRDKRTSEQ